MSAIMEKLGLSASADTLVGDLKNPGELDHNQGNNATQTRRREERTQRYWNGDTGGRGGRGLAVFFTLCHRAIAGNSPGVSRREGGSSSINATSSDAAETHAQTL